MYALVRVIRFIEKRKYADEVREVAIWINTREEGVKNFQIFAFYTLWTAPNVSGYQRNEDVEIGTSPLVNIVGHASCANTSNGLFVILYLYLYLPSQRCECVIGDSHLGVSMSTWAKLRIGGSYCRTVHCFINLRHSYEAMGASGSKKKDLNRAIKSGKNAKVKRILREHPDWLREEVGPASYEKTPLHLACWNNQEEIVAFLIQEEKERVEDDSSTPSYNMGDLWTPGRQFNRLWPIFWATFQSAFGAVFWPIELRREQQ